MNSHLRAITINYYTLYRRFFVETATAVRTIEIKASYCLCDNRNGKLAIICEQVQPTAVRSRSSASHNDLQSRHSFTLDPNIQFSMPWPLLPGYPDFQTKRSQVCLLISPPRTILLKPSPKNGFENIFEPSVILRLRTQSPCLQVRVGNFQLNFQNIH